MFYLSGSEEVFHGAQCVSHVDGDMIEHGGCDGDGDRANSLGEAHVQVQLALEVSFHRGLAG